MTFSSYANLEVVKLRSGGYTYRIRPIMKKIKPVGAPRKSSGAADEDVRLAIVVPGTLRDEALRKAQSEDLSLS